MDAAAVTAITGAIDYATVVTGIGGIGAAVVLVIVAYRGAKILLGMARS